MVEIRIKLNHIYFFRFYSSLFYQNYFQSFYIWNLRNSIFLNGLLGILKHKLVIATLLASDNSACSWNQSSASCSVIILPPKQKLLHHLHFWKKNNNFHPRHTQNVLPHTQQPYHQTHDKSYAGKDALPGDNWHAV